MSNSIEVAVFPVAGLGTRFLPVTKSSPKEMLAIIDKPLIQYAVEEAVRAGIKELVFVTNCSKHALEDYFDRNFELETRLQQAQKFDLLAKITTLLPADVKISYVRQKTPRGLGDAVLCAEHVVGKRDFAVLLADVVLPERYPCLETMVQAYRQTGNAQLAVQTKPDDELYKYGVVALDATNNITGVVEKPAPGTAPSNKTILGRYVLPAEIFSILKCTKTGVGGEVQLTDAIATLLQQQRIGAVNYTGELFDCGSVPGLVAATLYYAKQREDCAALFGNVVGV